MLSNEELLAQGECPHPNCIEAAGHDGPHSADIQPVLPKAATEAVEKRLLDTATDCGHDGGWDGSRECPKHPEGRRFGFYNQHQADITWRCWACLVDEVTGWAEAEKKLAKQRWLIAALVATEYQTHHEDCPRLRDSQCACWITSVFDTAESIILGGTE